MIVDNASPQELIGKIDGQVWILPCREDEVNLWQQELRVTNISRDDRSGDVLLRVLSETFPGEAAYTVKPTLEDYYLTVFGESGEKIEKSGGSE